MAAKKETAPELKRIKFKLATEGSKAFTSRGPMLSGSVCDLPVAQADRFCALDLAAPSDHDLVIIEPVCDVEGIELPDAS